MATDPALSLVPRPAAPSLPDVDAVAETAQAMHDAVSTVIDGKSGVVRTSLIYGGPGNEPSKHEVAALDPTATFYDDELRCPVQVGDLAVALLELVGADCIGPLHVAGAHAVSRADFAELIAGVREELRLHAGYADQWEVKLAGVEPAPATVAYTDFVLATAALGGVGLTCAAMVPCMRLYAHLGQSLDADAAGPYGEWVRTYADPGFEALAVTLEDLLDGHATDGPEVRRAYRRAMDLELGFFDAAGVIS